MKMHPQQGGCKTGSYLDVSGSGIPHNGLHIRTCFVVKTDLQALGSACGGHKQRYKAKQEAQLLHV